METERIFFAHPKAWDDERINDFAKAVHDSIEAETSHDVLVIPGRDDFNENIASEGNYNGWCRSITRRTDSRGDRFYGVIVVPKAPEGIGKATAAIIKDALDLRVPVVEAELVDGSLNIAAVVGIETVDDEDYISGWKLTTHTVQ
jgi:hypothetical protein